MQEQNQELQEELDRLLKSGTRQQRRCSSGGSSARKRAGRRSGQVWFRHRDGRMPRATRAFRSLTLIL
ncbi:MAG: hypothetical protein AB7H80_06875 [Candidatus Kapaibacterium sp.]